MDFRTAKHLPQDYYHCFMGNGLDAVLVGYSGSMVSEKIGVDRCNWYKADRYYPEHKLVHVAGRFPMEKPLEHAEGSAWFEIAPLGRTWYEVYQDGQLFEIQSSRQRFVPQEGILYTDLEFGPLKARVTSFLHAQRSLLIEHYEFSQEVELRGWMAPGVWIEEGWDTDPFEKVEMTSDHCEGWYDLGETQGSYNLHLDPSPTRLLKKDLDRGLAAKGRVFTKYFSILDSRQGAHDEAAFQDLISPGYESLRLEHLAFWQEYFSRSRFLIPDDQFQNLYDASLYHFKAAQNRISGGLPVNNLRRTWSSHIFWDSYFIQRALLEANRRTEALEACRFFQRTLDHARNHARNEFGTAGLKWDWEITHDGRKAYGTLLHMKFQVHNNASYANEIWQYYLFTEDKAFLEEFLPILEGLATFFMEGIIERTSKGWEIGPLVGVHENPVKVKNEGISLAGTIVILEHYADAAGIWSRENNFSKRCREVALGLRRTLDRLYTGQYFASAEGKTNLNMSSMAPIYPMMLIPFQDPRALNTANAMLEFNNQRTYREGRTYNFPWSWGVLTTIFARQSKGDLAWEILQNTRPTICQFGGMTEVMEDNNWNMQYFGTAQAAVVTALHNLVLQGVGSQVDLFSAVPFQWQAVSFERLLSNGMEISAQLDQAGVNGEVRNITTGVIQRTISWRDLTDQTGRTITLSLEPGETYDFSWKK